MDFSNIRAHCLGMHTSNIIFGKPGKGTKTFPPYPDFILHDLFSYQWMVSLEK